MPHRNLHKRKRFYIELVNATYDKMLAYAISKTIDPLQAYDLAQDACVTAWINLDKVMASPNPHGWMMNALKNHMYKFFESQKLEMQYVDRLADVECSEEIGMPDVADSLSGLAEEVTFSSILTPDEMRILRMKAQGYRNYEIADILGMKTNQLNTKVSRMKTKIGKFLQETG